MTDDIHAYQCPKCGAPLEIPDDHDRFFKCSYCGTTLEDEASEDEQDTGVFKLKISGASIESIPTYQVKGPPIAAAPEVPTGNRSALVIVIAILVVGIGIAGLVIPAGIMSTTFGVLFESFNNGGGQEVIEDLVNGEDNSGLGGWVLSSFGPLRTMDSDNDTSPDIIGIGRFTDGTEHLFYLDFDMLPALRWVAEPLNEQASFTTNNLVADQNRVYYAYNGSLHAYNRQSGALDWMVELTDEIVENICRNCLQSFDSRVIALTADGMLQAFDKDSGEKTWSLLLNKTPRELLNFNGNPAVPDELEEGVQILVFDPNNGAQIGSIAPQCPNEPFPNDPQTPGIFNPLPVSGDGKSLYTFSGFFEPGCLIRWDSADPEPVWEVTFPVSVIRTLTWDRLLLTETNLIVANRDGAYSFEIANGVFKELLTDEDYAFLTVGASDGVLVLLAERTRGTFREELWGVDLSSGEILWTYIPEAEESYSEPVSVVHTGGLWAADLTSTGLTVVEFFQDPGRLEIKTLGLRDGMPIQSVQSALPQEIGSIWVDILGFQQNKIWFAAGRTVLVIDLETGSQIHVWP